MVLECINNQQQLQLELLIGREISHDQIHLALIRTLNRNLGPIYVEISDETEFAVQAELAKGKEVNGMGMPPFQQPWFITNCLIVQDGYHSMPRK
jgi:hypothetical protein